MNERSVFLAALDKTDAAERAAYLDAACAGDDALRQQVELLLRAHVPEDSFLEKPAVALRATVAYEPLREGPGTLIGPYKLLQQIGEGGMGVVYMAEQQEPVRRKVALKIIKPGMDSAQVVARFEAERQALALMDHQNIARIYDAGTTSQIRNPKSEIRNPDGSIASGFGFRASDFSEGRPYFVMELVHGVPITKYCDDNHLTPKERLELFVPVCQAVQHAHQKGIIHRDLKPTNVLVCLYDGNPVPKIIDFGVAKATSQPLTERTMFTQFGTLVGTLEYMSPEQAEMSQLGIDTRSDVYSLGVLLYELLTGATPLERKRLREAAFDEVLRIIREEEPSKPSTRLSTSGAALAGISAQRKTEPGRLTRLVRGELDWIVMKALEKDRARRYDTASGLARDIERYLKDEPVEACPPSASYRLRKFVHKHKAPLTAAGVFALLLIVTTSVSVRQAILAERERAAAQAERAVAQAVSNFLREDLLAQADPTSQTETAPDPDLKVRTVLDRASAHVADRFEGQPLVEAALRSTIGRAYLDLGLYPQAQGHLEKSLVLYRGERGEESPNTVTAMHDLGLLYLLQGNFTAAEPLLTDSLERDRRLRGEDHRNTLTMRTTLALLYEDQGRYDRAEPLLVDVLDRRRRILGEEHLDTLGAMHFLAVLYEDQGRFDQAELLLSRVLEVSRRNLGEDHPFTLVSLHTLAGLLRKQKRLDRAESLYLQALKGRRRVLGDENWNTLLTMSGLGAAYLAQEEFRKAEPLLRECLSIYERKFPDNWRRFHVRSLLGASLLGQKRYEEAEPLLLSGHEGLTTCARTIAAPERKYLDEAGERVAQLYDVWGKQDKAAKWRAKLKAEVEADH